jgi:hypothetical protein
MKTDNNFIAYANHQNDEILGVGRNQNQKIAAEQAVQYLLRIKPNP